MTLEIPMPARTGGDDETIALRRPPSSDERRSPSQLREHYQIEKALAARLRNARRDERRGLYSSLYDELFARIPNHSQLTKKASPVERISQVASQLLLLRRFLRRDTTFLEIGAGDCALSLAIAPHVRKVYALDVSATISDTATHPDNFELVLSDGTSIPTPKGSVDVAYSFQLMEHLHPDDALEQLRNIYDALAPGGVYLCITPSGLTGPHDISRYFDDVATGFHLKEYTAREVVELFRATGFRRIGMHLRVRGRYPRVPPMVVRAVEHAIAALPARTRRAITAHKTVGAVLDLRVAAVK